MIGIRNPEGWNPESRWLESGIQMVEIRNPDGWNAESRGLESGIQMVGIRNPEGWNPESRWLECGIQRVGIRNPEGWNPESETPVDSVTWGDAGPATTSQTAKFGRPSAEKNNVELAKLQATTHKTGYNQSYSKIWQT